jgi:predicted ATPase
MPTETTTNRITRLRIEGFRSLRKIELELDGLAVLIGENGSGKSSIVEALQLLHQVGAGKLSESFLRNHGGFAETLRDGSKEIVLEIGAEISSRSATYRLVLANLGFGAVVIAEEALDYWARPEADRPLQVIRRDRKGGQVFSPTDRRWLPIDVAADEPMLTAFGRLPPQVVIDHVRQLLLGIEVRPALSVAPAWATRMTGRENPIRESALVQPLNRLSMLADDLAAAYHILRNDRPRAHWDETLDAVRLGLGPDVDILLPPDVGAGRVGLALMLRGRKRFAVQLSDGTLSYLALVAACRLGEARSLLVLDEPDAHLHPALQARVMTLLDDVSVRHPVLAATHSDTLLDGLSDPVNDAVVCALDAEGSTQLRRLDKISFDQWRNEYRGLGQLRAEGWLEQVLGSAS